MATLFGVPADDIVSIQLARGGDPVVVDQAETVTVDIKGYVQFKVDGGPWVAVNVDHIESVHFTP